MNILVTGATGFIGKNLIKRLVQDKTHKIFCITRNCHKAQFLAPFVSELIQADISVKSSLAKISNYNIDILFHCAGYVNDRNRKKLYKVNILGTENVCQLALTLRVRRFVYLSSVAVVSGNPQVPLTENLPYHATNLYGESKITAEKKVIHYRNEGLPAIIIRPSMVYGEDEPHLLRKLLFLLRHHLLPVFNDGQNFLHLAYVNNVVELMIFCLERREFLEGSFFIADKEALTVKEVFTILSRAINAKPPFAIPSYLEPLLLHLPWLGKKIGFFLKDRIYSLKPVEALDFAIPYEVRSSLFESAQKTYYENQDVQ